jgi:pimeloyl-ACP methyl ester carboxylesterase
MLVLLHGFCEDSSVWSELLPHLSGVPTFCLDLPGFGTAPQPASAGMEGYAQAVRDALDAAGIGKCVLVGHSMGGYAALEFAARWPERLAGLGLFHSHPYADPPERLAARLRGIEMLRSGKKDLYVTQLFPGLFAPAFAEAHPEVVNALIFNGKKQSADAIIAALEGMMHRRDHQDTLRNLSCPVQFLLGAEDALVPLDMGLQSATLPSQADVRVLPGVGHMAMFEATEVVVQALREFWQRSMNDEL